MYNFFMRNVREEMKARVEVRKWGHSLGLILPRELTKKHGIREYEKVEIKLKKVSGAEELFGKLHFGKPAKKIIKEIKEGWKD